MLWFLFLKSMELFHGNTEFPRAVLELQGCVFVCMCMPLHVQGVPGPGLEPGCCSSLHPLMSFLFQNWISHPWNLQVWLAAKFCSRGKGVFNNRIFSSSLHAGPQQPQNAEEPGSLRSRHCTEAFPLYSSSDCSVLPLGQHMWGWKWGQRQEKGNAIW